MWIAGDRLQVIDSALDGGRRDDVEQLLADIFRSGRGEGAVPTTCPTCRRDLVRNPLPGVGLHVSACPDRHGAWMTSDVIETLHRFVAEHTTLAAWKRQHLRVLNRLLAVLAVSCLGAIVFTYPARVVVGAVKYVTRTSAWLALDSDWPTR